MTRARRLFAISLLIFAAGAAHAELYRWTDEKGGVHVTDTPPPASARSVERQKPLANVVPGTQPPYELAVAMKDFPVVLYTSPNCSEGCERARSALNARGVPFREVQVWDAQTNEAMKKATGANLAPTLTVGRSVHQGFDQGAYDALLDSARYPKAGTVPRRNQGAPQLPEGYAQSERDQQVPKPEPVKPQAEESTRPAGPYAPGAPRQGSRPRQK
jgi:glutaredoxin